MQKGTPTSDRIGAYRVLQELSVRGPVQVHLACQEAPDGPSQNVVLKVVPDAPGRGAKNRQELIREGTACSRMTHPGIVRTSKVFRHQDAVVFVVEHVEGVSLADIQGHATAEAQRPLSDDAALLIGLSICDALAHAHATFDEVDGRSPIVHRTVNPSNILIGRDGSVKLDGFGFAKVFGGVTAGATDETTWTPAYMAPEQVKDQPPTPKVDVYAAALILWELLTGRKATILPRDPLAIEATLKAVAERQVEPLAKLRPDLPAALTAAIDLALAPEPSDRNVNCGEMGRHIRKTFQFARGKGQLRDHVAAALARAPAKEPRPTPQAEPAVPSAPASVPRAPASAPRASAPRVAASAPRVEPSAPRAEPSAPRLEASAPRVAPNSPRSPASVPRLNAVAPRAMHQTLVGIAPLRLEHAAAATPAAAEPAAPPEAPNPPPPVPNAQASALPPPLPAGPIASNAMAAAPPPPVSEAVATAESLAVSDEIAESEIPDISEDVAPAPRSVVSAGVRAQVNPFASTMNAAGPIAADALAARDPANRVAIPPELAATLPLSFDHDALRSEALSVLDRGSGRHSSQLAVTSDTLAAPSDEEGSAAEKGLIAAGVPQRFTLGELLKAPTPWRRSPWVAAWVVLALSLGGLVVKVASFRRPVGLVGARTLTAVQSAAAPVAPLPVMTASPVARQPVAPPPVAPQLPSAAPSPPLAAAPPSPPPTTPPTEAVAPARAEPALAAASPPTVVDEALKKSLLKRGLGLLTIQSTASHASVYVNLKLYGGVGEGLTIPCGKQFISIGVPPRRPAQPVWLAPGKSMVIPCGGVLETTMNPRPLR